MGGCGELETAYSNSIVSILFDCSDDYLKNTYKISYFLGTNNTGSILVEYA